MLVLFFNCGFGDGLPHQLRPQDIGPQFTVEGIEREGARGSRGITEAACEKERVGSG